MTIFAPGTEAPDGSKTVPRIAPPDVWADTVAAVMTTNSVETQLPDCWTNEITWTMGRPRLTNGPKTGKIRVDDGHLPPGPPRISRSDLASFVVMEAERCNYIRRVIGVCA
jgi:hypothetical protein